MGSSSTKEKTSTSSWVSHPQPVRAIPDSSSHHHQSGNLDRIPKKTIWEARIIMENEKNKQPIRTKNAFKHTSHRLKQISYLRLTLDDGIASQHREVQSLHQSLRNIKSLNKLSLKCSYSFDSSSYLRTLSYELKKNAKSLKTLNLDLDPSVEMTAKEIKALFSLLNHFRYISNLKLGLAWSNVTLKELGPTLKRLRSLTKLHLTTGSSIRSSINLDAEAIEEFILSLRLVPLLSNLSLSLYSGCIDDRGLQSLSSGLKNLSTLSSFSFTLIGNTKVTSQGINDFLMNLGSLTWISGLGFGLFDCGQVNDTVMTSLCPVLKQRLTSLSSLKLMLDSHMGEQPITQLSRCFSDLPLLSSLTLYSWEWDNQISNNDLEVLILALQQLKCLSSLHIQLIDGGCVNDKGIKVFSKYLQNLSCLSSFTFVFAFSKRISNKGIEYLCKALSQLILLTKLSLNFTGCQNIMSGVTEHLYAMSKRLNFLSVLELKFDFLSKFDQKKLNEFASQLKRVNPSLRLIKISGHQGLNNDFSYIKDYDYF